MRTQRRNTSRGPTTERNGNTGIRRLRLKVTGDLSPTTIRELAREQGHTLSAEQAEDLAGLWVSARPYYPRSFEELTSILAIGAEEVRL